MGVLPTPTTKSPSLDINRPVIAFSSEADNRGECEAPKVPGLSPTNTPSLLTSQVPRLPALLSNLAKNGGGGSLNPLPQLFTELRKALFLHLPVYCKAYYDGSF